MAKIRKQTEIEINTVAKGRKQTEIERNTVARGRKHEAEGE